MEVSQAQFSYMEQKIGPRTCKFFLQVGPLKLCGVWYVPVIPADGRLKQKAHQSGVHGEVRPHLETTCHLLPPASNSS